MTVSKNSRVLITGAAGMVGRNLCEHEAARGWEVLTPTRGELNLTDPEKIRGYLSETKPQVIIHAAGMVGGIQANIANPVAFLTENMLMGVHLVNQAAAVGITHFLNIGSSCMYPRHAENPLKESQILTGELEPTNEGYALAKISTMKLCEYVRKENPNFRYQTLIPCNLFGRFDSFSPEKSHLLPSIITKMHRAMADGDKEVEIWGDGTARREFMYAGDLADAIWSFLDNWPTAMTEMNIGLGYDYSVKDYYQTVAAVLGWKGDFVFDLDKPTGMKQKLLDVTQQTQWGWQAETSLEDGIRKTYDFFLKQAERSI